MASAPQDAGAPTPVAAGAVPTPATPAAAPGEVDRAVGDAVLTVLRRLLAEASVRTTVAAVGEVLVEEARRRVRVSDCLIGIVPAGRPENWTIVATAGSWAPTLLGRELAAGGTVAARAMDLRTPVETLDLPGESRIGSLPAVGGIGTARVVPLLLPASLPDGRPVLGVMGFYRVGRDPFSADERHLIDEYARFVTGELYRAELSAEAAESARRLSLVLGMAVDVAASLDPRVVIQRVLRRAVDAVGADRGALLVRVAGGWRIEDSHDVDGGATMVGEVLSAQRVFEEAAEGRRPIVDPDYDEDEVPEPLLPLLRARHHSVVVPLVSGDDVLAVLVMVRRREPSFGRDQVATLQLMGNVAALAVRNAQLYAQAQQAHDRMVALENVKAEFLRLASHELRGPLGLARGYVSMIEDGSLGAVPDQVRRVLPVVSRKLGEMNMLIDQMLETARLEDSRMQLALDEWDLREVVTETVDAMRPLTGPQHDLRVDVGDVPVVVHVDVHRVGMVLTNLLENAIKYSPDGGEIRVAVRVAERVAEVTVTDQGLGIHPDAQPRLFTRFGRVVTPETSHIPGTGLGLYLARELARMHDGDLTVASAPGVGSEFTLRLPLFI